MIRPVTAALFASTLLFSAELSQTPSDAALVIYNSGIGLVHEKRHVSVERGKQSIVYPGVATTVQTDSVNVVLPKGLVLYSQQYRFDKITLDKIIEAHLGRQVRYKTGPAEHRRVDSGMLIATRPAVVKTGRGIESGIGAEAFIFDAIPDTLIMKPSLVWNVDAAKKTEGTMTLDYLISGIRWKSDYILKLDGGKGDLTGWITVDNRSGKRFEQIRLRLLAGDINRVTAPARYADAVLMEKAMPATAVAREAVEGYHLYSVPFDVTIADNEKTQIKFVDRPAHALTRLYETTMQPPYSTAGELKRPVIQSVELSEFDIPLPGGTVRTYAEASGTTVLLGESALENTPKNEKVTLRLGTNFDLVAKNKLIERSDDTLYYSAKIRYSLANRSEESKTVDVIIPGINNAGGFKTSVTTSESYSRPDGYSLKFRFTLKAGATKAWDVSYRTRKR